MKRLNYLLIIIFTIGLISCEKDDDKVTYNSSDFVGEWIIISTFIEGEYSNDEFHDNLNDTLNLNSDGSASIRGTKYKEDGEFDYYLITEIGMWSYSSESNYMYIDINARRVDEDGNIDNLINIIAIRGKVNKLSPNLVLQDNYESVGGNINVNRELKKIE